MPVNDCEGDGDRVRTCVEEGVSVDEAVSVALRVPDVDWLRVFCCDAVVLCDCVPDCEGDACWDAEAVDVDEVVTERV